MTRTTQQAERWPILSGKDMILARKPALQSLARESGLDGALDFLDFFLSAPYFGQNVPHATLKAFRLLPNVVLTRRAKLPRVLLRYVGAQLEAAVFTFEYALHGIPTGCYIPADSDGYRTVIAPVGIREQVAVEAGEYILKSGGLLLSLSYMQGQEEEWMSAQDIRKERQAGRTLLAHQVREVGRRLPLAESFEATLASVSRNTRHNLRRSMQQASGELGAEFRGHAEVDLPTLLELAEHSAYRPPDWVVQERLAAVTGLPGGVLAGLRGKDGQWLSVVGAHRERDMLCLDWQLNRSCLGTISVATAMRAFLIESEIARGTRWLRFESGTTHPLQRAFVQEKTHDLLFARRILPLALVKRLAAGMAEGGPLATVLASDALVWRS